MPSSMGEGGFRSRLTGLYREYRAICILTNGLAPEDRVRVDRMLEDLPTKPSKELRSLYNPLKKRVEDLRTRYGATARAQDLIDLVDTSSVPGSLYLFLPKSFIERLFTRYDCAIPGFGELPPSARVPIDVHGIRTQSSCVEILVLEAILFEDMALLWNDLQELQSRGTTGAGFERRLHAKRIDALSRATARAAFALVEGYLNSVAAVILDTRDVTDEERVKLTEWDEARDRRRFLTLEEKIQQYPRLALQLEHPPLHRNNCQEMDKVLALEHRVRRSLVHPSPIDDLVEEESREERFLFFSAAEAGQLCDAVVGLIRRIAGVVGPRFGDAETWLHGRERDGRFPNRSFE